MCGCAVAVSLSTPYVTDGGRNWQTPQTGEAAGSSGGYT